MYGINKLIPLIPTFPPQGIPFLSSVQFILTPKGERSELPILFFYFYSMDTFFPLLLLTLISASGFLLYTRKKIPRGILNLLIGLGAGSMLSLSLVHIFPEAIEENSFAVYAFLAGFLIIYLVEEILT